MQVQFPRQLFHCTSCALNAEELVLDRVSSLVVREMEVPVPVRATQKVSLKVMLLAKITRDSVLNQRCFSVFGR